MESTQSRSSVSVLGSRDVFAQTAMLELRSVLGSQDVFAQTAMLELIFCFK